MTGKERVIAALTFKDFDQVPIEINDCAVPLFTYPDWFKGGRPNAVGRYTVQWEPAMPNIFERMQHIRGTENFEYTVFCGVAGMPNFPNRRKSKKKPE